MDIYDIVFWPNVAELISQRHRGTASNYAVKQTAFRRRLTQALGLELRAGPGNFDSAIGGISAR
jgi:hypothetical protein